MRLSRWLGRRLARPKRKALGTKQRFEVFKRDQFTCQYCGAHPPAVVLHVDHIVAVAAGGQNEDDNLITACSDCNLGKGARALGDVPQSLADKAAEIRERESQLAGFNEVMSARRERLERDCWTALDAYMERFGLESIPRADFQSVKRFVEALGVSDCIDAMDMALAKSLRSDYQTFRYFCGICWRWVREGRQ